MSKLNKFDFDDVMVDLERATAVLKIVHQFLNRELVAMEKDHDVLAYRFVAERIKNEFEPAFGLALVQLMDCITLLKRKEQEDPENEG